MQFYRPCRLDPDKHRRTEFSCGNAIYDQWLRMYSGQNRRNNTAATWVIADIDYTVVCYATLSMAAVDATACPKPLAKNAPAQVPALLIGRLATDARVSGLGLGTQMVRHVLATAVELSASAACKAVLVNALNVDAYRWWQRFGFAPLDAEDSGSLDLYILTKDIERTIRAAPRS